MRGPTDIIGSLLGQDRMVYEIYDLWCPGVNIWYQDDLNALLSPEIYDEIVCPVHRIIPKGYEYSLFHLHPASFFILDSLLTIEGLKVVQINKDEGGPPIDEMIPVFRKVREKKNLAIWGSLSPEEVNCITERLPPEGIYVMIAVATAEECNAFR